MAESPHKFKSRDGVQLSSVVGDKADSGDTTVLAVGPNDIVKVYGFSVSADATLTGDIHLEIGTTQVTGKMRNAIVGGTHWIFPITGSYLIGAKGEDIIVSNTVAEAISYAVYYIVVTP